MIEIIKLGPFLIKYKLLVTVIAGVIGYLFLTLKIKKIDLDKRIITEIIIETIGLSIFLWKFGEILFDPKIIWRSPFSILYLNGNDKTFIIAIVSSILFLYYKIKKNNISIYKFLDLLPSGVLPFLFVYNLFIPVYGYKTTMLWGGSLSSTEKYHPINLYLAAIIICFYIFTLKLKEKVGSGVTFYQTVITLGVSGLFLTFLSPQYIEFIGISTYQLFYILLLMIGVIKPIKKHNFDKGEIS
ncbi:hypothetical protein [Metabacillus idriensis]|uniref:hypothetical protein n=1 Tax=Metabacillus idriensis TaxID=324768 RepID=UPI00174CC5C3|nr:hypothetical protein [Metabacillus idriensis]